MLVSTFDPFHNLALSASVAAIPILLFLLCLTILKMEGIHVDLVNLSIILWKPKYIFLLNGREMKIEKHSAGKVIKAWSP
ncbi:hypothetical protein [Domibacillus sp.]|uniref:hypothetical protein n=1 Tax=Domibacillus sp. TaxID=1969783 RepID=UPI0028126F52|nr:hypothetical protein [Domibacillus sp.]